ncbi:MAG TPA: biosynthetic-type acetolactate synthase large subunit [Dehalococcoidales bacterium]|nr:biosynthetic-type acetolactate synthase large subunit [Dehalococcoidales bacterium]
MGSMKAAEAMVKILEDEGVEVIFGIPGAGILPFYSALRKSKIRHFLARHEEGASHTADGYARASGKVGVCVGTSGPAGTNMVTGLYTAQVDSIPLIAITGQAVTAQLGKEAFQAVEIVEIVKPVTKQSYCVKEAGQLPSITREAFRIAREGRPGPVLIDLPLDVQRQEIEYEPDTDSSLEIRKPAPDRRKIRRALEMVLSAEKPLLLLGGGVIRADACDEFVALAEYLAIPVVTSLMGKGGIAADHPLYAGQVGTSCNTIYGNQAFLESDLVLGIGCRFSDRHTGTLDVYTKDRKFIHIDIEPTQIGRIIPADLGIVADAKLALQALLETAREMTPPREPAGRVLFIPEQREKYQRRLDFDQVPIKPQRVFKEINEFFDEDTIFATCIGLNQIWSSQFQRVFRPRHYLIPGGAGPLGWDLPAAIGAKVAHPDKTVVDIVGDYGIGFCGEELAMAVMYQIPLIVIVINNGYLSLIRQQEKYVYDMNFEVNTWYDGMYVDFVKFAEAYDAYGQRVEKPEEIRPALQRALETNRPSIIEVIVDREADASMGASLDKIKEYEPLPDAVAVT